MKSQKIIAAFAFAVLGVLTVWAFTGQPSTDKSADKVTAAEVKKDDQKKEEAPKPTTYNYVAQPGDSYSVLARKAVQTYGIVNKVNLSQAQILAAETNLTVKAGSPLLNEGESVKFDVATVKSAVEAAQKLSAVEQAGWHLYVADVDFNTNRAGQAS